MPAKPMQAGKADKQAARSEKRGADSCASQPAADAAVGAATGSVMQGMPTAATEAPSGAQHGAAHGAAATTTGAAQTAPMGGGHSHTTPTAQTATTAAQPAAAATQPAAAGTAASREQFLQQVMQGTSRLRDLGAAKAEGYSRITGGDGAQIHVMNEQYMQDGKALDPSRPEVLIYRQRSSDKAFELIGAMFQQGPGAPLTNALGLKMHDHGTGDTSTHVWMTPGNLDVAFGDREDPPDELMGEDAYTRNGAWRGNGMDGIRSSFAAL